MDPPAAPAANATIGTKTYQSLKNPANNPTLGVVVLQSHAQGVGGAHYSPIGFPKMAFWMGNIQNGLGKTGWARLGRGSGRGKKTS